MSDEFLRRALGMDFEADIEVPTENALVPINEEESASLEDDFEYVIDNLKDLIAQGQDAINELMLVAKQSQHPRAFEVIAVLLKATADMNNDILAAHKKKHDIKPNATPSYTKGVGGVTNNLFVGSTAELQNFLEQQKNDKYE